jgi:predicted dinucleotide-binding enzyme
MRAEQNIAVLGTGEVGKALATKLAVLGHKVTLGARDAGHEGASAWAQAHHDKGARAGSFHDAVAAADVVFVAVKGEAALAALTAAGADALQGKIVVDVTNPLDFSRSFPPSLLVSNTDSMGEQLQRAFPDARIVKSLNTVHNSVMVDPGRVPGNHTIFVAGNDAEAKEAVTALLRGFGWSDVLDLGDISACRGLEAWLLLWIRLYGTLKTGDFNIQVVRGTVL